jgi:hypothetical protein
MSFPRRRESIRPLKVSMDSRFRGNDEGIRCLRFLKLSNIIQTLTAAPAQTNKSQPLPRRSAIPFSPAWVSSP